VADLDLYFIGCFGKLDFFIGGLVDYNMRVNYEWHWGLLGSRWQF
jgi:hypothetical protein